MKTLSPRKANSFKALCSLKRDNIDTKEYWFSIHENGITLTKQKNGESMTQQVVIDKKTFNKFIDWYNKDQKL